MTYFEYDVGFGLIYNDKCVDSNTAMVRTLKPLSDPIEYEEMVRNLTHTVRAAMQLVPGESVSQTDINAVRSALVVKVESVRLKYVSTQEE